MSDQAERPIIPLERFYYGDPESPAPNTPVRPGVSAVLFDADRRILFMKRNKSEFWSLPGGRMDLGESAQECCVRETLEETGLETRVVRIISVNSDPRSIIHYPDGNIFQSFVICFEAEILSGELRHSPESEAFCRRGPEEIDSLNLVPDSRINAMDAWAGQVAAFIR